MKRLTCTTRKKNFDFISKHWFQFSGALLQTMSAGNYPTQPQMALCCGWLPPTARALVKALNMFSGSKIFQGTEGHAPSLQTVYYL